MQAVKFRFRGNSDISKNPHTSLLNFIPISGLWKILHSTSTIAGVVNLVRPAIVSSSSHWPSSLRYNMMGGHDRARRVGPSTAAETCAKLSWEESENRPVSELQYQL